MVNTVLKSNASSRFSLEFALKNDSLRAYEEGWFRSPDNGDAGFDIRSSESVSLEPGVHQTIETGIFLKIPDGFVGFIKDRSSRAIAGLKTSGGVIDASYRGEIKVIIVNDTKKDISIKFGEKIAQIVIIPCITALESEVSLEELGSTDRGNKGFGSSGKF